MGKENRHEDVVPAVYAGCREDIEKDKKVMQGYTGGKGEAVEGENKWTYQPRIRTLV